MIWFWVQKMNKKKEHKHNIGVFKGDGWLSRHRYINFELIYFSIKQNIK